MNASGSRRARMATYSAVHGPDARERRPASGAARSGRRRGRSRRRPARTASASATRARRRPAGMAKAPGSRSASSTSAAGVGKRWVIVPSGPGSGSPAACTSRPATVRAPGTETCWPMTARTASSKPSAAPGTRRPGSARPPRPQERVVAQGLPDGDGVGVEVEQLAAARHRGVQVAQVREHELALHVGRAATAPRSPAASGAAQRDDAVAVGQAQAAPCTDAPSSDSTPGSARTTEEVEHRQRDERPPAGQAQPDRLGAPAPGRRRCGRARMRAARARSPLGVSAKIWRTVSLHWRTLANPAAKATWATGRSVVSSRRRAVWLRWARARASGPVPTSVVMSRFSWRVL